VIPRYSISHMSAGCDGPVTALRGISGRQAGNGREAQPGTGTTGAHH